MMMLWGSTGGQQVKSPHKNNFGTLPDRLKVKESLVAKRSWSKPRMQQTQLTPQSNRIGERINPFGKF